MSARAAPIGLSVDRVRIGLFALFGLGFLALAVPAFAEPMTFWTGIVFGDYAYPSHEVHHFVLGGLFSVLLLGVLAQAIRPRNRVGALHTAIIIWASLTVVFTAGGEFSPIQLVLFGLLAGMAATHPAGREQLPSPSDLDRAMAVVAAMTALAVLAFAFGELSAHRTATDDHVVFGHYTFMATAGVSVAALGLYASFRGTGWRFPVYAAAVCIAIVGLGSIAYPGVEQGSSLGVGLGAATTLWAIVFVAVAEREALGFRGP